MMASSDDSISLSPAVVQVVDQFVIALRVDEKIPDHAIDRLEAILRQGIVPKPDQILEILFAPPEQESDETAAEADVEGSQP